METAWLMAIILAPLFFNVYTQRVFEPDKISMVRNVALFGLVAGVIKLIEMWDSARKDGDDDKRFWQEPLVLPVVALAATYLLSTALSVTPRQSFWGSYQRLQGTFTMLSYIILFFVTLGVMRREEQWRRLQYTIILISLPIALYGIMQHYHLDPLPWGGDTTTRIAANMGNSIFLAAWLIMAVPLTIERLLTAVRKMLRDDNGSQADAIIAGATLFVLLVQVIAILFTQSRGPWIGLAMGLYVFGLLILTSLRQQAAGARKLAGKDIVMGIGAGLAGIVILGLGLFFFARSNDIFGMMVLLLALILALAFYLVPLFRKTGWRWLWLSFITQSVVVVLLVIMLNVSPNFLPGFRTVPYVGRLAQLMDSEHGTGRVRVLIWQGVVDMMLRPHEPLQFPDGHQDKLNAIRPLVGYGPESMWVAYNRFYRPELGELEHRNASPDRSHNETFDSLVNTGILGFLAYFALFLSIFYFSLKWLGLIADKLSRYLFFILGISGAALGALTPWVLGVPEFMGVGLPLGFITGELIYITLAAFRGSDEISSLERRHILIIAIFATLVAHFVEIHFGIAIVSTRTTFFILAAALAVLGTEKVSFTAPVAASAPLPARSTGKRKSRNKHRHSRRASSISSRGHHLLPMWRQILPWAALLGIILLILDWNYISGQIITTNPFTIFFKSWFYHLAGNKMVWGTGAITLVFFTLVVGMAMALGEVWNDKFSVSDAITAGLIGLAVAVGMWLVGGLIIATRMVQMPANTPALQQIARLANNFTIFNILLWIAGLGLTWLLYWNHNEVSKQWARRPLLSGLSGAAVGLLALYMAFSVNINLVRADVYFKVGQGADSNNDWRNAIAFYDKATELAPKEDYYFLFRGRAMLENGRYAKDNNARQTYFQKAEQILQQAQTLNPLNTDHSANLARFYGTIANYLTDPAEKRIYLNKSAEAYRTATMLSPHSAHLWNELGSVYMRLGEMDKAREAFQHSLSLDPGYADTYKRLGQLELSMKNWQAALDTYQKALQLSPDDPHIHSGIAYALAKLGRFDEAIAENKKVLELRPNDLGALQNLALLYKEMKQYDLALTYARQALQIAPEDSKPELQSMIKQIEAAQGE